MYINNEKKYNRDIQCWASMTRFQHGRDGSGNLNSMCVEIGSRCQTIYEHSHESLEILAVEEGTLYLVAGGEEYTLHEGEVGIVSPYENHMCLMEKADELLNYRVVLLEPRFFIPAVQCTIGTRLHELLNGKIRIEPHLQMGEERTARAFRLIRDLCIHSDRRQTMDGEVGLLTATYELLGLILSEQQEEEAAQGRTPTRSRDFILKVTDYIQLNFNQPISTADICQTLNYNKTHFCHLFRDNFDDNFTTYLCKYRVTRAAADYRDSHMPVTEIAASVGFNDYCHFSRSFKRYIGVSPAKYFRGK